MDATGESLVETQRGEGMERARREGEEGAGALSPYPSHGAREREQEKHAGEEPGAPPPADEADWRERAESAESRATELGDRLGAIEAAAEDLRRMVGESERARRIDRELLIAGVADMDGARALVEEQLAGGATVLEAVSRVRERKPLLFVPRGRGVRATGVPATTPGAARSADEVARAARETGDRRLLLRYLRMRRGEG